jgi:hypothetical protein
MTRSLGNVNSARQWFARAAYAERSYVDIFAKHYDELPVSNQNNGSTRAQFAIQDAILAGDSRLIEVTAGQVLDLSDDYPNEYLGTGETYYKACFVASLATGDMASAATYRDRCRDVVDDPDEYVTALLRTYDGFLDEDSHAVEANLQELVDIHADAAEDLSRWLQVMSPAAGALFLLAKDRGMEITVDSWYLPDGLRTYGLDEDINRPRPEYLREELIITAD